MKEELAIVLAIVILMAATFVPFVILLDLPDRCEAQPVVTIEEPEVPAKLPEVEVEDVPVVTEEIKIPEQSKIDVPDIVVTVNIPEVDVPEVTVDVVPDYSNIDLMPYVFAGIDMEKVQDPKTYETLVEYLQEHPEIVEVIVNGEN